jgi:sialate O-acetylesterase
VGASLFAVSCRQFFQALILGGLVALAARADVTLASLFQDYAVLQRDQPVPVWGRAEPGEHVLVEFRGQAVNTTADADGRWQVTLAPMSASAKPSELVVRGRNTITIAGVLTGEVWLASGQSNMEWRVEQAANARVEIAAATHPLVREFDVPNVVAESPRVEAAGKWVTCSPDAVAKFSAVAYYFARELQRSAGVPVGIINSSWGGTPVEAWTRASVLGQNPAFRGALDRWQQTVAEYPAKKADYEAARPAWEKADAAALAQNKAAQAAFRKENPRPRVPRGPGHHWTPAGLYNGMIAPLVPYAFRGVIWYQGESNADYPEEYAEMFAAMITHWRGDWGREFPFYFVQIANFNGNAADRAPDQWAWLREAQARALALPATGMAVTIDIGTPGNIHPGNKQEVGRRLALLARRDVLQEKIVASGPVFTAARREGSALRLEFQHATGLTSGSAPLTDFVVAGADRKFHPAEARVEGTSVIVTSRDVASPVAARYAWRNAPIARLRNGAGLPAAPFRTDDWEK